MADCETWTFNPAKPCCGGGKCGKPCWTGDNANLWIFAEDPTVGLAYRRSPDGLRGYWKKDPVVFNSDYVVQLDADGKPTGVGPGKSAYQVFFRCSGFGDDLYYYQIRYRTAYAPFDPADGSRWADPSHLTRGYMSIEDDRFGPVGTPLGDDPWAFGGGSGDYAPSAPGDPWYGDSAVNAVVTQAVEVVPSAPGFSWTFDTSFHAAAGSSATIDGRSYAVVAVPPPIAAPTSTFSLGRLGGTECCRLWCPPCRSYVETFADIDGRRAFYLGQADGGASWTVSPAGSLLMTSHVRYYPDGTGNVNGPNLDTPFRGSVTFTLTCDDGGLKLGRSFRGFGVGRYDEATASCASPIFDMPNPGEIYRVRSADGLNEQWITVDEIPTSIAVKLYPIPKDTGPMACGAVPLPKGKNLTLTVDGREFVLKPDGGSWTSDVYDPGVAYPGASRPGLPSGSPVVLKFSATTGGISVQAAVKGTTNFVTYVSFPFASDAHVFYWLSPDENGSVSTSPLHIDFENRTGDRDAASTLGLVHFTLTR